MTTYYLVKVVRVTGFELCSSAPDKDILVINKRTFLPGSAKDLIVLHEKHANRSREMLWNAEEGTFTCQHCGQKVSVSETLFKGILGRLSQESYRSVDDGLGVKASIAHFVNKFPTVIPAEGYYALEQVEGNSSGVGVIDS